MLELETQQQRNPDSLFEIAIVLLGLLSAGELQYYIVVPDGIPLIKILRIFTIPFVTLIGLWLLNEALIKNLDHRFAIIIKDFCWGLWCHLLFFYLLSVIGSDILIATPQLALSALFYVIIFLGYSRHARLLDEQYYRLYFKSNVWISEKLIMYALSYFWVNFTVSSILFGRIF